MTNKFLSILIIESDDKNAESLINSILGNGNNPIRANSLKEGLKIISEKSIGLILVNLEDFSSQVKLFVHQVKLIYNFQAPWIIGYVSDEGKIDRSFFNLNLSDVWLTGSFQFIREKIENWKVHDVVKKIISECSSITKKYASTNAIMQPQPLNYEQLAKEVKQVFIALHGRPGEDGDIQEKLEQVGLSYNGSGKESSSITIDKFKTNEILLKNGFLAAKHCLISKEEWNTNKVSIQSVLEKDYKFPLIAKPVDDGCSSAVKKIKSFAEFEAFATLIFRDDEQLIASAADVLHIKPKEEFPRKQVILVEELISKKDARHFLEITGGMLTKFNAAGELEYEVFEASEALAEGDVLSLEEKFLAGQGQNITPARYAKDPVERQKISDQVKATLGAAAKVLNVVGYCRIDAFVRVYDNLKTEVIFIEVNSLPGMTPATCIYHQAAINNYKPYEFINNILEFGAKRFSTKKIN